MWLKYVVDVSYCYIIRWEQYTGYEVFHNANTVIILVMGQGQAPPPPEKKMFGLRVHCKSSNVLDFVQGLRSQLNLFFSLTSKILVILY